MTLIEKNIVLVTALERIANEMQVRVSHGHNAPVEWLERRIDVARKALAIADVRSENLATKIAVGLNTQVRQ